MRRDGTEGKYLGEGPGCTVQPSAAVTELDDDSRELLAVDSGCEDGR